MSHDFGHVWLTLMDKSETDYFQISFIGTTRWSAIKHKREINYVYGPTPDISETSPHGHPDLRGGFLNPPHAGEARWNPNCSAKAKKMNKMRPLQETSDCEKIGTI